MIQTNDNRICLLGMGYVGLTLAVVMSECGFEVTGVDINPSTICALKRGMAHFYEVGLNARLARQVKLGKLNFVSDYNSDLVKACGTFVLTVGTPLGADGKPRMDMVSRAASQVAASMAENSLVILRSTVKLGTTRNVVKPILDETGKSYMLAYCPERTIEGKALEELRYLPQIIGGFKEEDVWRATQLFQRITPTTIRVSSLEAAEIVKLLDNSYRDLFFSFGNEVALLCESAGLDGIEIVNAANTGYERTSIARPGLVGGPCLEKDPHILAESMKQYNFVPQLISMGRALNEGLPCEIVKLIDRQMNGSPIPPTAKIAITGLAFKGRPETDDLRSTPSKYLIQALKQRFPQANLVGHDFAVTPEGIQSLGLVPVAIDDVFEGSQIVVIANNNVKYQWINMDEMFSKMVAPGLVFDIWDSLQIERSHAPKGIKYLRLGSATAWGNS